MSFPIGARAALRHPAEIVRLIVDRLDGDKDFKRSGLLPVADVGREARREDSLITGRPIGQQHGIHTAAFP